MTQVFFTQFLLGIFNLGTIYFWNSNLGTMSQNGKYQNTVFHSFAKLQQNATPKTQITKLIFVKKLLKVKIK